MKQDFLLAKLACSLVANGLPFSDGINAGVAAMVGVITAWLVCRGLRLELQT